MLNNKRYPMPLINKLKKILNKSERDQIPHVWEEEFKERKEFLVFKADMSKFLKLD